MFEKLSFKLFGQLFSQHLNYFDNLKSLLKKARIRIHVHDYLCMIMFYAFPIAFSISLIVLSILFSILTGSITYAVTTSFVMSIAITAVVFGAGYYYPGMKIGGIKKKIDKSLPFATTYMVTSASSGMNPVEMFRMLSVRGGIIGEEAKTIYNDVKSMGMNLTSALQKAALRSPSSMFSDLLYGIVSVITSGGDLDVYLKEKSKSYFAFYKRQLDEYSKMLTLYTEIYITLIMVGTLFFMVLLSIMSPIIGSSVLIIESFVVFVFTPLVSLAFIIILKTISPEE